MTEAINKAKFDHEVKTKSLEESLKLLEVKVKETVRNITLFFISKEIYIYVYIYI